MIIQHNMAALFGERQLNITNNKRAKSQERLSSGYRINRAADDAAGLTISEKMRSQIRGLNKASVNAQDGISLIQVAEGALNETHEILHRMNELATQAANDTNTSADRAAIKEEIDALALEIDRVAETTQFNSMNILDGTFVDKKLQVGALNGQSIDMDIFAMDTHVLGLSCPWFKDDSNKANLDKVLGITPSVEDINTKDETSIAYKGWHVFVVGTDKKAKYESSDMEYKLCVDNNENAGKTMKLLQNAVDIVSEMRSKLGAMQNRLEHTVKNLDNTSENISAAESRIRDTDMASEMVVFSKENILAQAGQSMLAQANTQTQGILQLLS